MNQDYTHTQAFVSGKRRVVLGMSGGVDSSVAAALLQRAGYEVLGVTCLFSDDESVQQAVEDARAVAERLGIRHVVYDARALFEERVVRDFVDGYACGMTPSPCVGCNARVKIPALFAAAEQAMADADDGANAGIADAADSAPDFFVATGHYARVARRRDRFAVARAADLSKDQSYMLSLLSQEQLARLVLPLGDIEGGKPEVRRIAQELGLPVASKSDSQDICFIPDGNHLAFLEHRGVSAASGDIVTRDGIVVGRHDGLFCYTIGQRKGLGIGGAPEPYYVVGKDAVRNRLIVGFAHEARIDCVRLARMNWQAASPEELAARFAERGPLACSVKLRYRQHAVPCRLVPADMEGDMGLAFVNSRGMQFKPVGVEGSIPAATVLLDQPQTPTAPGQFAVLYDGDAVLGAGVIESVRLAEEA